MTATIPRRPRIGGVAGGVATSIVAALIGGEDLGVVAPGDDVDVLVCRSVSNQLSVATRIAAAAPVAPVVVISADSPNRAPHQVRERARMLEPNVPAVVWLDWVEQARSMSNPPADLRAAAISDALEAWSMRLRAFRHTLIAAVTALLSSAPVSVDHDTPHTSSPDEEHPRLRRTS